MEMAVGFDRLHTRASAFLRHGSRRGGERAAGMMQHSAGSQEGCGEHAGDAVRLGAGGPNKDLRVGRPVRQARVRNAAVGPFPPVTPMAQEVGAAA